MRRYFDLNTLKRTYRDPLAWVILAVDLFPIVAVLTLGWGAAPLVFLYWLENVIVGAVALLRMIAASVTKGVMGMGMLFLGPFFTVHYGGFCFVHGQFVNMYASMGPGGKILNGGPGFPNPLELIQNALASGAYMTWFVTAIVAVQALLFVRDFILRGEFRTAKIEEEMSAPYTRIFVLHIGIFAGAGALMLIGNPLWGILGLIVLRAIWGVFLTIRRRMRLDGSLPQQKVDGPSPI